MVRCASEALGWPNTVRELGHAAQVCMWTDAWRQSTLGCGSSPCYASAGRGFGSDLAILGARRSPGVPLGMGEDFRTVVSIAVSSSSPMFTLLLAGSFWNNSIHFSTNVFLSGSAEPRICCTRRCFRRYGQLGKSRQPVEVVPQERDACVDQNTRGCGAANCIDWKLCWASVIVNVHVDALWERFCTKPRSTEKSTNVRDVFRTMKVFFLLTFASSRGLESRSSPSRVTTCV